MIELVVFAAMLMKIGEMASARRMNVKLWVGITATGWIALTLLFRFFLPLGFVFALLGWLFVSSVVIYINLQKVPPRLSTDPDFDELEKLMGQAREHQERDNGNTHV